MARALQTRRSMLDEERAGQSQRFAEFGVLASMVIHDVGSPLSASLLHSGELLRRLQREGADESLCELARRSIEGLDRAVELVRDFQEALRDSSESHVEIDLVSLVERARRLLEADAAQRGVRLWLDVGTDRPVVCGNAGQLLRVMDNVIRNALEAVDRGGTVVLSVQQPSSRIAQVAVRDDGPGVPEDFDPFAMFATRKPSGTGLGLAIAAHFVRAHGGEMFLEPGVPNGTVARVQLPVVEPE